MRRAILMTLLAIAGSGAAAGQTSYSCTAQNVYQLDEKGRIKEDAPSTRIMRGERFSVDVLTGRIAGERIPAFPAVKFAVLSPSGRGAPFRVYFQGYNYVSYLEVYEHQEGEAKPFVLHDAENIFSGFCE